MLIDVPAGAVGDVLDEAELLRLRRTYAGTVTPPWKVSSDAVKMILPAPRSSMGGGQAIMIDPKTNALLGASDNRKDGMALGY